MVKSKRRVGETSFDNSSEDTKIILSAINESLAILTQRFDKQEESIKALVLENATLVEENKRLNSNQNYFNNTIEYLRGEINDLQQEKLNRDITITNIPTQFPIDSNICVDKILDVIGADKSTLVNHYTVSRNRYGGRGKYINIILKFSTAEAQQKVLLDKKQKGLILYNQIFDNQQLTDSTAERQIYINERLTTYNLEILQEARRIQRKGSVKFAWHQRGTVLIKQKEGGPVIKIKSLDQLQYYDIDPEQQQ
jgi:hypothetical protein